MPYALNIHTDVGQWYRNKTRKNKLKNSYESKKSQQQPKEF